MPVTAHHWICGQWLPSQDGGEAESVNPANGEVLGAFSVAGRLEADRAIEAARAAFEGSAWPHQPQQRSAALMAIADRLEAAQPELTRQLTDENGKLLAEAEHEITAAISEARYYAGLARNIFGRVSEVDRGLYATLAKEALGVAGIIVPWNAPITLMVRSLAPAMAAGCTAVVKAAPQTALVNASVFRLLADIDAIPAGVVNMINEIGNDAARTLVSSPLVDVISYTGSTEIGKQIMADAAGTLKCLNLELGGSAPCVVFSDADLDKAVPMIVRAGTVMAGQMCTAASRVIVHRSRFQETVSQLRARMCELNVGPGQDPASDMGPMIDPQNRDRIASLVSACEADDEVLLKGQRLLGALAKGAFVGPSLVAVGHPESILLTQEVFGPVLSVEAFEDEAEAIALANRSRFGLAASIWTSDLKRGLRVAGQIHCGTVWINNHNRLFAEAETGGYKQSGLGRLHGAEGLEAFLQTKHISWDSDELSI